MDEKPLTIHTLAFERDVNGKRETFHAICNEERGGILLEGVLRYSLEMNDLVEFIREADRALLEKAAHRVQDGDARVDLCQCGSRKHQVIGKGVWRWGPNIGNEFDILQCDSCGRQFKRISVHY
jgi:hypothetical protein